MKIRKIPISKLKTAKYNPRKDLKPGDPEYERIKKSIERWGLDIPLVWNEYNSRLVGGHQRLKILKVLKYKYVYCSVIHTEDELDERERNIAYNRANGDWNPFALQEDVTDLEAKGVDMGWHDLEELMPSAQEESEKPLKDPEPSEPPEKPRSKRGAIYILGGNHRLMCGDATDADDVKQLMAGTKAKMVFTDPPYNVRYGEAKNPRHKIRGMEGDKQDAESWLKFCRDFTLNIKNFCEGDIYVWGASMPDGMRMRLNLVEMGCHHSATIIWVKQQLVLTPAKYQRKYEPCFYGWFGKSSFRADRKQTEVWECDRPLKSDLHPTMKPTNLCATGIRNSSENKDIVLDLFGGAGSTLIACEQLGRICHMMELDLKYVDVIRKRFWKLMTGEETGWEAATQP